MKYRMILKIVADVEFLDSTLPQQTEKVAKQKVMLCLDKKRGVNVVLLNILDKYKLS